MGYRPLVAPVWSSRTLSNVRYAVTQGRTSKTVRYTLLHWVPSPFQVRTFDYEFWCDEGGDDRERMAQQALVPFMSRGKNVKVRSVPNAYQAGESILVRMDPTLQ